MTSILTALNAASAASVAGEQAVPAMSVGGTHDLRLWINEIQITTDPAAFARFCITQRLDRYLPSFRMTAPVNSVGYTNLIPFDETVAISVDISDALREEEPANYFNFLMYRRFPESRVGNYDFDSLLNVYNLIENTHTRGFSGTVKETIQTIADELVLKYSTYVPRQQKKVDAIISSSLNYKRNIVQCNQTNAQLLTSLKNSLIGSNGEGPFYCFLTCRNGRVEFRFQSLNELASQDPKYYFCYGGSAIAKANQSSKIEILQIWDFEITDNYMQVGGDGLVESNATFFNYTTGSAALVSADNSQLYSLSTKLMVRKSEENIYLAEERGRSDDFHGTFEDSTANQHYKKMMSLSRIRISSFGRHNVCPGDVVQLIFTTPSAPSHAHSFQYQGRWLVESVDYLVSDTFAMSLRLARPGLDADLSTNLVDATQGPLIGK